MNSLSILLSYEFVSKKVKLTWKDILYGINKKYIPLSAAIEHAIYEISYIDEISQELMYIASLHKREYELVYPVLNKLANQDIGQNDISTSEKWLYLLLEWLYEYRDSYSEPLGIVEYLYADFEYPEIIASFIRYMPSDEPDLGSLELNETRLYEKWKTYLDNQRERFLKETDSY